MCVAVHEGVHLVFVVGIVEIVNRSGTDSFTKRIRSEVRLSDGGSDRASGRVVDLAPSICFEDPLHCRPRIHIRPTLTLRLARHQQIAPGGSPYLRKTDSGAPCTF